MGRREHLEEVPLLWWTRLQLQRGWRLPLLTLRPGSSGAAIAMLLAVGCKASEPTARTAAPSPDSSAYVDQDASRAEPFSTDPTPCVDEHGESPNAGCIADAETEPLPCVKQGAMLDAKFAERQCCEGLVRSDVLIPSSDDSFYPEFPKGCGPGPVPDSTKICLACGDGQCTEAENFCSCPQDCARQDAGLDASMNR